MIDIPLRRHIVSLIISRPDYLGKYRAYNGLLTFLNKIWPLRTMPSTDERFSNAYDDINQHTINNDDWSNEFLYESRLNLSEGEEEIFFRFLETVASPETRLSKEEISFYVSLINAQLTAAAVKLTLVDYFEELPVYRVKDKESFKDLPNDIAANSIPFYKSGVPNKRYPCFVLYYDNWDDYHHKTKVVLNFNQTDDGEFTKVGDLKIMKRGVQETWKELPDLFTNLSNDFCSLGQEIDFYSTLKEQFPNAYQSILLALRDVALFPKILEEFETDNIFTTSLIRFNSVEKLLRTVRFELQGNITDYFTFSYLFKPPYADTPVTLQFNFDYESPLQHRIYALIGKNGTGKTTILSSLAEQLALQNPEFIIPRKPLHSKYFTVSYSYFDRFEIPEQNAGFNYVYCGLKKSNGTILSEDEQVAGFLESVAKIKKREFLNDWYGVLINFLPPAFLNPIFTKVDETSSVEILSFNETEFSRIRARLSSGESILFYILTKIVSEIRDDSLILYDEPETHLHPNAISALMNTLFELVKRFRSYCILATHSPLVIREIHARDVLILQRDGQDLEVKKMERDSFGENLTVITEEIFGNREVNKHHHDILKQFVEEGKTFEEILAQFEYEGLPVSLSTRLYLKSLLSDHNEEPKIL